MSAVEGGGARLADRIDGDAHNVLLLAPPMDDCDDDGCVELLSTGPPAEEDVLFVTFVDTPDRRLQAWRSRAGGDHPAKLGFVSVGETTRSAAAPPQPLASRGIEDGVFGSGASGPGDLTVRTVARPGDLTDLGITTSEYLTEWEDDGNRTAICFHSLTTLLQYVDLQRAFRFLHVLTGRVRVADGLAHYHMDPSAHDELTVNTVKTLFDGVVERDGDDWQVRNR